MLVRFAHWKQGLLLRRCLLLVMGLSASQMTMQMTGYINEGERRPSCEEPVRGFWSKCMLEDIGLLAETHALHGRVSGPGMRKILERAWMVFGDWRSQYGLVSDRAQTRAGCSQRPSGDEH